MSTDIITTYVPAASEISEEAVLSVRERLSDFLREKWPDLDTRPNSVFGDLFLTPASYMVAGLEEGMNRFMSDLDLENVSNGVIWNCEFVTKYLGNFAVYDRATLQSTGLVRIRFNEDKVYFLDRRTKFGLGGDDTTNLFSLRMPHSGGWDINKVGVTPTANSNNVTLVDAGDGTYFVDVPVVGIMDTQVFAGDESTIDPTIAEIISITALQNFDFGTPPESLSRLAEKTRQTIYAASMGARGPARRFLEKEFPDLKAISVALSGDSVMLRDTVNALGVADGRMDVYSKSTWLTDTQVVTAVYDATEAQFVVKLSLSGRPVYIDSITYGAAGTPLPADTYTILSRTNDVMNANLATAAYSKYEDLYLLVELLVNEAGDELISTGHDADGNKVASFTITYRQDPMLPVLDLTLSSSDVAPVGVNTLVRGFVPIVFTKFNIKYTKRPGTTLRLSDARTEIFNYVNELGHPYLYSDAKIIDAMFYAGASDVREIDVAATVRWSIADAFLPADGADPAEDLTTALSEAVPPPDVTISNSRGLKPEFVDPFVGLSNETLVAVGARNITYVLDKALIEFTEIEEE
jgi:hypothetical protein